MTHDKTLQYLATGIRQLSAAAAQSQLDMRSVRIKIKAGGKGRKAGQRVLLDDLDDTTPLDALDTLARTLAEPYLLAIQKLERRLEGAGE